MPQSRRHERPRSSRSQHSNPGGASCRSSAFVAQTIAAAMIWATDALERQLAPPGFECCERELLGRSKRRVSDMRKFRKKHFLGGPQHFLKIGSSG